MFLFLLVGFTLLFGEARAAHQSGQRLRKRFSGDATYYDVGLGACGGTNVPSDYVVALNAPQFDAAGTGYPSPYCGKSLTITYNGKTALATVVDKCPGCADGDLDMSQGLFEFFAPTSVGRFAMSWTWSDSASAPAPSPTTSTYVAPTTAPSPTVTTIQTVAQTTSSVIPPTTSSTSSSSSESGSIVSSSSGSAAPSSTGQPNNNNPGIGDDGLGPPGNVLVLQEAIINLGSLIRLAAIHS